MKQPKKVINYFTQETEDAVIEYNTSDCPAFKSRIFEKKIYPAFVKIAENLINRYRFYYIDEDIKVSQYLAVIHLMSKLPDYHQERGKAFSFFTKVCYHFLIQANNKAYKDKCRHVQHSGVEHDVIDEEPNHERVLFFDVMTEYIEANFNELFPEKCEQKIAESILILINHKHDLNLNRKAIYIQIREITNEPQNVIAGTVKKMKIIYSKLFNIYIREKDDLDWSASMLNDYKLN